MRGMSGSVRFRQDVWVCDVCGARRRCDPGSDAPVCGALSSEMTRFPDGGWVRVEQWEQHPPMRLLGDELRFDPLLVQVVEEARVVREEAMLRAAEESVRRADEAARRQGDDHDHELQPQPEVEPISGSRCVRLSEGASCLLREGHVGDCVSAHTLDRWIRSGVEFSIDQLEG